MTKGSQVLLNPSAFHQPSIRSLLRTMISRANSLFSDSRLKGGRGPIQTVGPNFGHGMTQAPPHANDLWIALLCTLHPVQPHRQLSGHCYFGHAVVLPGL